MLFNEGDFFELKQSKVFYFRLLNYFYDEIVAMFLKYYNSTDFKEVKRVVLFENEAEIKEFCEKFRLVNHFSGNNELKLKITIKNLNDKKTFRLYWSIDNVKGLNPDLVSHLNNVFVETKDSKWLNEACQFIIHLIDYTFKEEQKQKELLQNEIKKTNVFIKEEIEKRL